MGWMIGVDTGGTFTDLVAVHRQTGEIKTVKVPSTPIDQSQAVLDGVRAFLELDAELRPDDITYFAHGTTVATNAVLERKGGPAGLLITRGTSAVYLARASRQPPNIELLNPNFKKPDPLIPGRLMREVSERIAYDGSVLETLQEEDVIAAVEDLVQVHKIGSIAICFLFSFMNPAHERRSLELIQARFPDIRVSISSEILPVVREYRRMSTTALDAFVGPTLHRYLDRLKTGLRTLGITTKQVFIMQSNGGLMSIDIAASNPVQTLLSGPAAGVISGSYLGGLTGFANVVTFDVGGTSTDISTIIDGEITETTEGAVAGHDCAIRMNEISTIGAGGGTIARVGTDGRLRVGPDSAGADPGPACFGKGGADATITDADLVLGYVDAGTFLDGKVSLDKARAEQVIKEQIAEPLGMSIEQAAYGVVKILNSHIEGELRLSLMGRGLNPREFALLAIGGGGPVRAGAVAKNLGISDVVVPPYPGLGSAMGLLLTDIRHTYLRSQLGRFSALTQETADRFFDELVARAMAEAEAEGSKAESVHCTKILEMRYVGQGYELPIACPTPLVIEDVRSRLSDDFHALHARTYGHSAADAEFEVVNFRVDSHSPLPKLAMQELEVGGDAALAPIPVASRQAYFEERGGYVDTPVYQRAVLAVGQEITGPAIIEQPDTTIILIPNQVGRHDKYGNFILSFAE